MTAALLATLFLGGMEGASDLDALLFHPASAATAEQPEAAQLAGRSAAPRAFEGVTPVGAAHIESAGNPNCHTERCVLELRLATGRVAAALALPIRFEGIPEHGTGARPPAAPYLAPFGRQPQSRAPPAPLA